MWECQIWTVIPIRKLLAWRSWNAMPGEHWKLVSIRRRWPHGRKEFRGMGGCQGSRHRYQISPVGPRCDRRRFISNVCRRWRCNHWRITDHHRGRRVGRRIRLESVLGHGVDANIRRRWRGDHWHIASRHRCRQDVRCRRLGKAVRHDDEAIWRTIMPATSKLCLGIGDRGRSHQRLVESRLCGGDAGKASQ
jgi:hypothetical protein